MTGTPRATRRRLLAAGGSVALLSIAGCLGNDEGNGNGDSQDTDGAADEDAADDEGDNHDEDEEDDDHDDHENLVANFALVDRETDEEVADLHDDHWHGDLPPIPLDGTVSLDGVFEDGDGEEIPVGDDEEYQFDAELAEGAQEGIVEVEGHGDHVDLSGEEVGRSDLVFSLWHDDHADWESPAITAEVVEESDDYDDDDEHADDHDDHDGNGSDDDHDEGND